MEWYVLLLIILVVAVIAILVTRLLAERGSRELHALNESQAKELEMLHVQIERERAEQTRQFAQQLTLVKEQLTTASQEMLRQRAEELNSANISQMKAIITPLQETIREMKVSMDGHRDQNNRNTASIEEQIRQMLSNVQAIGATADNLANALRHKNKTQGNWGEVILREILESQGLKEGVHYEEQVTLRDERGSVLRHEDTGKSMVPDVILHYPDNKDVVIDSKVSLTDFLDYVEADSEEQREQSLKKHLSSIRRHIRELSGKNYSHYIKNGRSSLNYVIMFVPNESALQLALVNDSHLWREAFDAGVFITGEQNLIAALRMIQLAWVQEKQRKNMEEVFRLADELLKRAGAFYTRFEKLGKGISDLQKLYDDTENKLKTGQQNMFVPARKLKEMGAKEDSKYPLPAPEEEECHDTDL